MKLFELTFSRTKKGRRETIMIDSLEKCEQYKKSRENSGNQSKAAKGFHFIEPVADGSKVWRKKTTTIGGNKCRHGQSQEGGYVSKAGFNPHT